MRFWGKKDKRRGRKGEKSNAGWLDPEDLPHERAKESTISS